MGFDFFDHFIQTGCIKLAICFLVVYEGNNACQPATQNILLAREKYNGTVGNI